MIKIFSDYFDNKGRRYKVLSFDGSRYACESYSTGKNYYFYSNELFDRPPKKYDKENIKTKSYTEDVTEPEYVAQETENFTEENSVEVKKPVDLEKDNNKETASDFYADF